MYTDRILKISVIDDDAQMREMIKDFITGKYPSSEVNIYSTGEEALKSIIDEQDFIVLDYNLDSIDPSAMNGLQALKKLKTLFPLVPVIFLSGQENAEVAANTMKYGAWDYIVKNESSFIRMEIHINNILGNVDLKKNLGSQKFFNRLLAFLVLALIAGMIYMRLN